MFPMFPMFPIPPMFPMFPIPDMPLPVPIVPMSSGFIAIPLFIISGFFSMGSIFLSLVPIGICMLPFMFIWLVVLPFLAPVPILMSVFIGFAVKNIGNLQLADHLNINSLIN